MEAPTTGAASNRWARRRSTENRSVGNLFERVAARWLRRRGERVIARQVRVAGVEVDLVVLGEKGTVRLVEVRGRTGEGHRPRDWLSGGKLDRLERAARGTFRGRPVAGLAFVEVVGPAPWCLRAVPWAVGLWPLRAWRVQAWNLER